MVTEKPMVELVTRLSQHLNERADQLRCFHAYASQLEGWFKGELLSFLDREKKAGSLGNFDREVLMPMPKSRKRIDIRLAFRTEDGVAVAWVELKHWFIGHQKNYEYNCNFYFSDPSPVGIKSDVDKLFKVQTGDKYLLILTTKNPEPNDWTTGVRKFNEKFRPLQVCVLTQPNDYPDYFFLGLLGV